MSASDCNCACPTPIVSTVPGTEGGNGDAGENGVSAFTLTAGTSDPATFDPGDTSIEITVASTEMFYVGQIISIEDSNSGAAGFFEIVGIAGTTLVVDYLNEGYNGAGAGIVAGKMVSPAGPPTSVTNPLPVANGGTGSATKAAAISALGVGQNATVANPTGLTQDITNSQTLIAGATVTAPAAGLYLVLAYATVAFDGVTFADRLITLRVRNTTSATTVAQAIKKTQSPTTAELPSYDFLVPFKTVSLAASDVLELQIGIDTVESAGDCEISEASIAIIPIALT